MKKIVSAMLIATLLLTGCNSVSGIDQAQLDNVQNVNAMSTPAKNGALAGNDIKGNFDSLTGGTGILNRTIFRSQLIILTDDKEFLNLSLAAFDKSDLNKDGNVNFEEFKILDVEFDKVIAPLKPKKNSLTNNETTIIPEAIINKIFSSIQSEVKEKNITEKSFIAFYSKYKNSNSKSADELKSIFTSLDTNKNRILTLDEFKKAFTKSSKNGIKSTVFQVAFVLLLPFFWVLSKFGIDLIHFQ